MNTTTDTRTKAEIARAYVARAEAPGTLTDAMRAKLERQKMAQTRA